MWIKTTNDRLVNADNLSEIYYRHNKTRGIDLVGDYVDLSSENIINKIRDAIIRGQDYLEVE